MKKMKMKMNKICHLMMFNFNEIINYICNYVIHI